MTRTLRLTLLALPLAGCASLVAPDGERATPQRPTLSNSTDTTAPDTLEVEFGIDRDPGDRLDTPTTLKYGAGPRTEVYLGLSPLVEVSGPTRDAAGPGDLLLGARHRVWENTGGDRSAAFQVAAKIPTADDDRGLGNGEVELFLAGIGTDVVASTTRTFFYELGFVADPDGDGIGLRHSFALAGSIPYDERLGLFGELAAIFDQNDADPLFATGGVTYALAASTILDAGLALGLNDDAPDLRFLIGITTNRGPQGLRLSAFD